ncbi:hypothetical protein SARC_11232 [Sphaeroforma arctica JP610]|uniref:Uncharacterized protein n=1 Tax=Sphaeroforma arctica JP610 TaxID=667725 RepID=A0A0L0FHN0_9EUKA|nr:hypothetical protein SARC_11232 [Sphaeroforma arctica JP610]KNC76260.1 hypothetical protein SARC_11232 [Sphaeroforma arctica JP610]|eukprot:XP_014150162.1 hypothetical protein SARC_11232 [Sphaeroforma arctica JP610]
METALKIKESGTYANVKWKDEEEILAHARCLIENSYSQHIQSNAVVALAPELKEVGLLELYVLSRKASIMEPVYKEPATHLRIRAEHIMLEDNEDVPFPVIREFGENTFMSLVG